MPLYSAFTPFGALAFSSKPSRVKQIYDANIAILNKEPNDNFNIVKGTNIEAMIYARSRTQAAARYVVDRVYNNANPLKATDTIPLLEQEFEVVPGPSDSLNDRRNVLAARSLLPNGATRTNVINALTALLGTGFVYYRVTKQSEVANYPTTGGDSPGNFVLPATIIKHYFIVGDVSVGLGAPQTVSYVGFDTSTPPILTGDKLTVDGKISGQTETVVASAATTSTFIGTFNKAHDPHTFITTAPYPFWTSNQRFALIVVTRAVAESREKRRQINELLARMLRGVSQWMIVPESAPASGTTATFTVEDPILGRVGYAGVETRTYP